MLLDRDSIVVRCCKRFILLQLGCRYTNLYLTFVCEWITSTAIISVSLLTLMLNEETVLWIAHKTPPPLLVLSFLYTLYSLRRKNFESAAIFSHVSVRAITVGLYLLISVCSDMSLQVMLREFVYSRDGSNFGVESCTSTRHWRLGTMQKFTTRTCSPASHLCAASLRRLCRYSRCIRVRSGFTNVVCFTPLTYGRLRAAWSILSRRARSLNVALNKDFPSFPGFVFHALETC